MIAPVCGSQGYPFRLWIEGDYHAWWVKKNNFPPLLETLPPGGLGAPGTVVLAGGDDLDRSFRNGGGLTMGAWFTDYQGFGIEGSFFVMESATKTFNIAGAGAAGALAIVRPFFDLSTGQPDFLAIASPGAGGTASGASQSIEGTSGRFSGVGMDFIANICCNGEWRVDFLIGYRYLMLDDRFSMTTTSPEALGQTVTSTPPVVTVLSPTTATITSTTTFLSLPPGNAVTIRDGINTSNQFNGADFGLRGEWHSGPWQLKANAKVAFGETDESIDLNGLTTATISTTTVTNTTIVTGIPSRVLPQPQATSISPPQSVILPGGFLVRPSNLGSLSRGVFTIVPELDLTVGYQYSDWLRFTLGYSALYWSQVARSADQINLNINPSEISALHLLNGPATVPTTMTLRTSNFWAQGINVGIEIRF